MNRDSLSPIQSHDPSGSQRSRSVSNGMNTPQTLIVLGPSGCGKGTQIKLIKKYWEEHGNTLPIAHLVMGDLFRTFWKESGYSQNISRKIVEAGDLQPGFMQVRLWSQFFVDHITGGEHLLIDGSPRRLIDAQLMESAFDFYKREKPMMVFIDCEREISKERILSRAKTENRTEDLKEEIIEKRLDWYEEFVIPAIDFFRGKEKFNFVEIDGNVSIEDVFEQIKEKVLES